MITLGRSCGDERKESKGERCSKVSRLPPRIPSKVKGCKADTQEAVPSQPWGGDETGAWSRAAGRAAALQTRQQTGRKRGEMKGSKTFWNGPSCLCCEASFLGGLQALDEL